MFSRMKASEAESTTSMTRIDGLVPSDKMA
jgi:hypothetical protein